MTNKETIERNIGLTFDYVEFLNDNPSITEKLPVKYKLEFIEKDFPRKETQKSGKVSKQSLKIVRIRNSFELSR
jgi:hypothetical protein